METKYVQCKRCVLDYPEVPDLTLDHDGVCQYCLDFDKREKARKVEKTNLPWKLFEIKKSGNGKKYDCLVGLSGGVDSSICLHYLVENGLRPLCFSVDNGYNDPKADENIMRLVEGLKVPFFRYVLNLERFKELQAAFIQSGVKNLEIPTDHVLMAASYEMSAKYGVKFIVSGGNMATESIMPECYGYQARDLKHIEAIYKRFTKKKLIGLPTISLPKYLYYRFVKGIQVFQMLDYYDYDREQSIKLLGEKYGYEPYGEKHCENVFTSWFQNFYLPTKWGLDKRKPHYSSLILSGQMTRAEATEKLAYAPVYPELGIERKAMKYPKKEYWEYPNNKKTWDLMSKLYGLRKGGR